MERIETAEEFSIDVKRFYVPFVVEIYCPDCKNKIESNLSDNYLSYPEVNKIEPITFYCSECNGEFEMDSILRVSLDIDRTSLKKI